MTTFRLPLSNPVTNSARHCRVAFFPCVEEMNANPYWPLLRSSLETRGVEFYSSTSGSFGRRWLWSRRGAVDVLHLHFIQQFYAYEGAQARLRWVLRFASSLILARALGYRTVFTLHDLVPMYPLRPAWVDYLGYWIAANFTERVIVHGEAARQALASRYGRRRNVHVIEHPHYIGVYPNMVTREAARSCLGLKKDQIVFGFIGGIRPNKGIDQLVVSFGEIPGDNLRLVIAGKLWPPAEYSARLTSLIEKDDRIRFFPQFIPDEDIQLYLNAVDVVVLPFASILTSGSTIMAMSFSRPVVAPALGCLPELINSKTGILYDPSDPEGLRNGMRSCLSRDLDAMGRAAYDSIKEASWEVAAEKTTAVYQASTALS